MVIGNHAGRVHGNIDVGHLAMAYLTQRKIPVEGEARSLPC